MAGEELIQQIVPQIDMGKLNETFREVVYTGKGQLYSVNLKLPSLENLTVGFFIPTVFLAPVKAPETIEKDPHEASFVVHFRVDCYIGNETEGFTLVPLQNGSPVYEFILTVPATIYTEEQMREHIHSFKLDVLDHSAAYHFARAAVGFLANNPDKYKIERA